MTEFSLNKNERLKGQKSIQSLFSGGRSTFSYPVRIQWQLTPRTGTEPVKAAFSVPKRKFKRAVDRNLLKRRMREAYRGNKSILTERPINEQFQIELMLVYSHGEVLAFDTINKGVRKALRKLISAYHADA